jgi:DNA-directed RNA polymerase specialized sigma24 family protein
MLGRDTPAVIRVMAIREDLIDWRPAEWLDDSGMVSSVQSFLECKKTRRPPPPSQQRAWDHFYRQYHPLVRRIIALSVCRPTSGVETDDLSQEVWGEIVVQLPKLTYRSTRANLSSWLAGLTRQKVRRLAGEPSHALTRYYSDVEDLVGALPSKNLGPEDACFLGEVWVQLETALAKLGERTSAKTFEVFWRRLFQGQAAKEIAAALELTPNEVCYRYRRAKCKWRELTRNMTVLGHAIDVPTRVKSPRPRRAR